MAGAMRRGEVFALKSDTVGKPRRVVVVSPPQLNAKRRDCVLVVPLMGSQVDRRQNWHCCVLVDGQSCGLDKTSVANCGDAYKCLLTDIRTGEGRKGQIPPETMAEIDQALKEAFGLCAWPAESPDYSRQPSSVRRGSK